MSNNFFPSLYEKEIVSKYMKENLSCLVGVELTILPNLSRRRVYALSNEAEYLTEID